MLEINHSELFKNAHKEAKATVDEVGDYMIAFSLALKDQWKKAKTIELSDSQIESLERDGWSRWTKYGYDRLYFDPVANGTIKLTYRKSGCLDATFWDGEETSHAIVGRVRQMKCFIDIRNAQQIKVTNYAWNREDEAEALKESAQESLNKVC